MQSEPLRVKLARVIAKAVLTEDYMASPDAFVLPDSLEIDYLDQGITNFGRIADAVLSMPEIAKALRDTLTVDNIVATRDFVDRPGVEL